MRLFRHLFQVVLVGSGLAMGSGASAQSAACGRYPLNQADHVCNCTGSERGSAWGSGPYTADSNICVAARHAGVIGVDGGEIRAIARPGQASYVGTIANGVRTSNWGNYGNSFDFLPQPQTPPAQEASRAACGRYPLNQADHVCNCTGSERGSVWGSGPYTADSNICVAARHAGVIGAEGGEIRAIARPGQASYVGTIANGLQTSNWGNYGSSFDFLPQLQTPPAQEASHSAEGLTEEDIRLVQILLMIELGDTMVSRSVLSALTSFPLDGILNAQTMALAEIYLRARGFRSDNNPVAAVRRLLDQPIYNSAAGVYSGRLQCGDNRPAATLAIYNSPRAETGLRVILDVEGRTGSARSLYELNPRDLRLGGSFRATFRHWITEPARGTASQIELRGRIDSRARQITGRAMTPGCSDFTLTRLAVPDLATIESIQRNEPVQAPLTALQEVSPDRMEGEWTAINMGFSRRNALRPELEWRGIWRFTLESRSTGAGTIELSRVENGSVVATANLSVEPRTTGFRLRHVSGAVFPIARSEVLRSRRGVDVFVPSVSGPSGTGAFFIRFRNTPTAEGMGIAGMTMQEFCGPPARALIRDIDAEVRAAETISRIAPVDPHSAAAFGLFAGTGFRTHFGQDYADLTREAQEEVIERLRTCAIYNPDRSSADPIGRALFGSNFGQNAIANEARLLSSYDPGRALNLLQTPAQIATRMAAIPGALQRLTAELESADRINADPDLEIERRHDVLLSYLGRLPPTFMAPRMQQSQAEMVSLRQRQQAVLDRESPALPTGDLVMNATNAYLVSHCNQAFTFLGGNQMRFNPVALAMVQSYEIRNGRCTIVMPTEILSLAVLDTVDETCAGTQNAVCRYQIRWSCDSQANPAFGFSAGTSHIPAVCLTIRTAPTRIEAVFERTATRRWTMLSFRNVDVR